MMSKRRTPPKNTGHVIRDDKYLIVSYSKKIFGKE
jgi:hypothetical protein